MAQNPNRNRLKSDQLNPDHLSPNPKQSSQETIVLVPGMYSPRLVLMFMAHRLRKSGFRTITLSNRYLLQTPAENAQRLLSKIQAMETGTLHLLGHSLGGIVIMHLLDQNSALVSGQRIPNGRVILMASPVLGSELAKKLYGMRWFRPLLGKSVQDGILGGAPVALHGRDTGVMSGSSRGGLSALFFHPKGINDGVVSRAETELTDACDVVCIPHSHALMLFSKESVDKAAAFFKRGRFV